MKPFIILFFCLVSTCALSQEKEIGWIDKWQQSTVSLGVIDSIHVKIDGDFVYKKYYRVIGTGVIFYLKDGTLTTPCLVTAKHIFEDSIENWLPEKIRIRFPWYDHRPIDEYFGIEVSLRRNKETLYINHPDKRVDLSCLILDSINAYDLDNNYIKVLPYSAIAKGQEFYVGAPIMVFGYPGAVGPEFLVKAIIRSGIISWVPSDFGSTEKILIDCEIFPGNSGGPVFTAPSGLTSSGGLYLEREPIFVGIVTQRRFSDLDLYFITDGQNPQKLPKDSSGNKIISLESIGIGVIEPSVYVLDLLKYAQDEVNK